MKILFITSRIPYPPFRGDKVRTYQLLKELHKHGHEVTLITFINSNKEKEYADNLQQYCNTVILTKLRTSKSILNCLLGVFSFLPFQVLYYTSTLMKKRIDLLLKTESFDLIHVHLIRMIQYVQEYDNKTRVVDLTDAGSLYLERFIKYEQSFIKKNLLSIELKRLREYEKNIEKFQCNLVCSGKDKSVLLQHVPKAKITIVNNGIDLSNITNQPFNFATTKRIIFTGNLTYFPNIDAIKYFVGEIFPMILLKDPEVCFFIVGQNPPTEIRRLANKNIIVTGFVENIYAEYLKSTIAVAPIRFGAGSQFKILEALALGIPVVTTSITAEGIDAVNSGDVMIADTPEKFRDMVLLLLADPGLCDTIASKGKKMIREKYSMDIIGDQLHHLYLQLTAEQ